MIYELYHGASSRSSFSPIACFAVVLQSFVCDRATPPPNEKLRSKGIAVHVYDVSVRALCESCVDHIRRVFSNPVTNIKFV